MTEHRDRGGKGALGMSFDNKICIAALLLCSAATANATGEVDASDKSPTVKAGLEFTVFYDDNIFATEDDTIDDYITLLKPTLGITINGKRHDIAIDSGAMLGRYRSHTDENFDDYWLESRGRLKVNNRFHLFGSLGFNAAHESRDSPDDDRSGDEPTTWRSYNADLGALLAIAGYRVRTGGTYEALRFDDVPSADAVLINEDRDRDLFGAGVRTERTLKNGSVAYAQINLDKRDYLWAQDLNGFRRDSTGYRFGAGMKRSNDNFSAEAFVGYLHQQYEEHSFADIDVLNFGASVRAQLNELTDASLELRRELKETTQFAASGYLQTDLDLKLNRRLDERATFSANAYYGYDDYHNINRKDHIFGLGASVEYAISADIYAAVEYQWTRHDARDATSAGQSDTYGLDYERKVLSLTLGAQFAP